MKGIIRLKQSLRLFLTKDHLHGYELGTDKSKKVKSRVLYELFGPVVLGDEAAGAISLAGSLYTHSLQHAISLTAALKGTTCWKKRGLGSEEERRGEEDIAKETE